SGAGRTDARFVEQCTGKGDVCTRSGQRRLEAVGRRKIRLCLSLRVGETLALDALLCLGESLAGVRKLLVGKLAMPFAGKRGVELEAGARHLALGRIDAVLAFG